MCWEPVHPNRITQVGGGLFFWHFILLNRSRVPQAQMYEEAWTAYSKQKFSEVWTVWTVWIGRVSQKTGSIKLLSQKVAWPCCSPKAIAILEDKEKTHWIVWIYINTPLNIHPIEFQHQKEDSLHKSLDVFQATHLASQLLEERPEDVAAQRLFKFGKPSGCDCWFLVGFL